MVVYIKTELHCNSMDELETPEDATVWLLFRKHGMRPIILGCIYRVQSQCTGVMPNLTNRNAEQIERWDQILEKWETNPND